MILRRVFPIETIGEIDFDAADGREQLTSSYRLDVPAYVRLNLITTLGGSAAGSDGTSESITNPIDRILLRTIRELADVVVVGAASVRVEGYYIPKRAALAVVTRSGDLSAHSIRTSGEHGPLLVVCPEDAAARAAETIGEAGGRVLPVPGTSGDLSATAIVDTLRAAGLSSIVAEGGPTLAAHLVAGGVVDELCLTTSAVLGGAPLPLFGNAAFGPEPLELIQLLLDDAGTTYARWRLPRAVA